MIAKDLYSSKERRLAALPASEHLYFMKTVLVCSQKGGTGKTLLADEIAFSMERTGNITRFIQLDTQGGSRHEESSLDEDQIVDVQVVDTPGYMQSDMPAFMQAADVIVIPCRASMSDLPPLDRMREMVQTYAPDTPVIIVHNCFDNFRASTQFAEMLQQTKAPNEIIVTLRLAQAFVWAGMVGESVVVSDPRSKATKNIIEVINVIRAAAGLDPEKAPEGKRSKLRTNRKAQKNNAQK